jgi:hypothetical protein
MKKQSKILEGWESPNYLLFITIRTYMCMYCGENLTSAKKRFIVFVCRLKYYERDMYFFVFIITPPGALQKRKKTAK